MAGTRVCAFNAHMERAHNARTAINVGRMADVRQLPLADVWLADAARTAAGRHGRRTATDGCAAVS